MLNKGRYGLLAVAMVIVCGFGLAGEAMAMTGEAVVEYPAGAKAGLLGISVSGHDLAIEAKTDDSDIKVAHHSIKVTAGIGQRYTVQLSVDGNTGTLRGETSGVQIPPIASSGGVPAKLVSSQTGEYADSGTWGFAVPGELPFASSDKYGDHPSADSTWRGIYAGGLASRIVFHGTGGVGSNQREVYIGVKLGRKVRPDKYRLGIMYTVTSGTIFSDDVPTDNDDTTNGDGAALITGSHEPTSAIEPGNDEEHIADNQGDGADGLDSDKDGIGDDQTVTDKPPLDGANGDNVDGTDSANNTNNANNTDAGADDVNDVNGNDNNEDAGGSGNANDGSECVGDDCDPVIPDSSQCVDTSLVAMANVVVTNNYRYGLTVDGRLLATETQHQHTQIGGDNILTTSVRHPDPDVRECWVDITDQIELPSGDGLASIAANTDGLVVISNSGKAFLIHAEQRGGQLIWLAEALANKPSMALSKVSAIEPVASTSMT